MKVSEIMRSPAQTVLPEASVTDVARIIQRHHLPGLIVVDAGGKPVGVVTQRDLVAKHATVHLPIYFSLLGFTIPLEQSRTEADLKRALAVSAQDLMEAKYPSVTADMEVDDAAQLMVDEDANPVPVMENGRLAGMLTDADIIRLLIIEESDDDRSAG